jgi:hypothetical protein
MKGRSEKAKEAILKFISPRGFALSILFSIMLQVSMPLRFQTKYTRDS